MTMIYIPGGPLGGNAWAHPSADALLAPLLLWFTAALILILLVTGSAQPLLGSLVMLLKLCRSCSCLRLLQQLQSSSQQQSGQTNYYWCLSCVLSCRSVTL